MPVAHSEAVRFHDKGPVLFVYLLDERDKLIGEEDGHQAKPALCRVLAWIDALLVNAQRL
jgi:hypothetical protein